MSDCIVLRPVTPAPWVADASCAQVHDPDEWFPEKSRRATIARQICRRCPVQAECLSFAIGLSENPEGIWGGTTEHERRLLRAVR